MNLVDVMEFARGFHGRVMEAFAHAAQDGVTRIVGRRASEIRVEIQVADGAPAGVGVRWQDWLGQGESLPEALADLRRTWEARGREPHDDEMQVADGESVRILRMRGGGYRVFKADKPAMNFGRYPSVEAVRRWASLNGWKVMGGPEAGRTDVVEFIGIQEGLNGAWTELWNLRADVEISMPNGKNRLIRGSTVGREQLEEAGILVPVLFPGAK